MKDISFLDAGGQGMLIVTLDAQSIKTTVQQAEQTEFFTSHLCHLGKI